MRSPRPARPGSALGQPGGLREQFGLLEPVPGKRVADDPVDAVAEGFVRLVERGDGELDYSALVMLLEEQAGVRVAGAPQAEEAT